MRVTSKGQVTIPIELRRKLGITPDVEVEFKETEGGALLFVARDKRDRAFREALERLKGTIDLDGMTTDEYMNWLRGYDEDADDPGFAD